MWNYNYNELHHSGIKGQRWGIRRYQNPDGTLTEAGKKREAKINAKIDSQISRKQSEYKSAAIASRVAAANAKKVGDDKEASDWKKNAKVLNKEAKAYDRDTAIKDIKKNRKKTSIAIGKAAVKAILTASSVGLTTLKLSKNPTLAIGAAATAAIVTGGATFANKTLKKK